MWSRKLMNELVCIEYVFLSFEALKCICMRKSIILFTIRLTNCNYTIICTIQEPWVVKDIIWKVWTYVYINRPTSINIV